MKGKVTWFNAAKGYGFIQPDEGGDPVYVHFSGIDMPGYKMLETDDEVTFRISEVHNRGRQAVDVRLIDGVRPMAWIELTRDAPVSEPTTPASTACNHAELMFGSGASYIICRQCSQRWVGLKLDALSDGDLDSKLGAQQLSGQRRSAK